VGVVLTVSLTRAEYTTALEIAERLLDLARKTHDTPLLVAVHSMQGLISQHVGEHLRGRAYLEHGSAVYDAQPPGSPTVLYGQDGGVACRAIASACWWLAGYPDQALTQSYAALALAHERAHPFSLALALSWTAIIHQFRREWLKAQQQAEAAIALCTEQGFSFWLDTCILYRGRALVSQGHREEGIRQVRQAVATRLATGAELDRPWCLASLAEVCQEVGQVEEGLAALSEALVAVQATGARSLEAELYRLKGELTLQRFNVQGSKFNVTNPQSLTPNPQAEAEACFHKAIEIARKQQAKSWELRASTSLARLWQQQRKKNEAHKMLAEIYGWFTEGFDTKDLQEAKALLDEFAEGQ